MFFCCLKLPIICRKMAQTLFLPERLGYHSSPSCDFMCRDAMCRNREELGLRGNAMVPWRIRRNQHILSESSAREKSPLTHHQLPRRNIYLNVPQCQVGECFRKLKLSPTVDVFPQPQCQGPESALSEVHAAVASGSIFQPLV